MIEIKIDTKEAERIADMLTSIPDGMEKATASAINRALSMTKTAASRKVRERYNVKAKYVKDSISIRRAGKSNLIGTMISRGTPIRLINFKVNPSRPNPKRRKPITVSVKKSGGGALKGAFVAEMSNESVGVFERVGLSRLPIQQLYGPSAPQMIGEDTIISELEEEASEIVIERLSHEAVRLLGRYKK
ncbi:MAG: hypothetical protein GXW90_00565 [Tepidanaerobacter acetatoxydans]|uniref:phage tail protein n=1 Tax=Tepidanaerobacter acetatoxydans TaxID=499229 RepID=UPI0026E9E97E|nr:phage tail protein [Tepidanaerobacter acetatoxydans]NLU09439.1 hypothetical protein [Tepidanaerobacter acetatoxydans]